MVRDQKNYKSWLKNYKQTDAFKKKNREWQKKYYDKNRENLNDKRRQCYQEDKEKDATYYKKNKKKIQEYQKKHYSENYERILARKKEKYKQRRNN